MAELLKRAVGDRDVEAFLADLSAGRLEPPERIELYLRLHEKYLREAEELYRRGILHKPARSIGARSHPC